MPNKYFLQLDPNNIHKNQSITHPCFQCPEQCANAASCVKRLEAISKNTNLQNLCCDCTEKTECNKSACPYVQQYDDIKRHQYSERASACIEQASNAKMRKRIGRLAKKRR